MMAPDYTHWHGTYDVAKTFYTHYVPDLRELVERVSIPAIPSGPGPPKRSGPSWMKS